MQFRVLGPLEVAGEDGPIALGGPRQRAFLAHLIVRANRVIPIDTLIDEVWGDEPPGRCSYEPCCPCARRAASSGETSSICVWNHQRLPNGSTTPALRSP